MNLKKCVPLKLRQLYWKISEGALRVIDTNNLYKHWEIEHLKKIFSRYGVDCVFDVGANYGQYAQMLRQDVNYKGLIISFEPIPEAAKFLREKSKGDSRWIVLEQALAECNGEKVFNVMVGSEFSSLSPPKHDEVDRFRNMNKVQATVNVKVENLTTAFNRLKNDHQFQRPFLKMDTQGYDVSIVKHSKEIMPEFIGLQSELSIKKIYEDSVDFRDAISLYEKCGFELSAFVPNNSGHFPILIEIDCIMIRKGISQLPVRHQVC